jgi:alpha-tubulin suppressor-like RCC1 family protein
VQRIKGEVKIASAGFYHTLAVTKSGMLFTWGDGRLGKLGHNDESTRLHPTIVNEFLDQVRALAASDKARAVGATP